MRSVALAAILGFTVTATEFIGTINSRGALFNGLFGDEGPGLLSPELLFRGAAAQREAALSAFRDQMRGPRARTPPTITMQRFQTAPRAEGTH